jgi:copper(I)-binding protein
MRRARWRPGGAWLAAGALALLACGGDLHRGASPRGEAQAASGGVAVYVPRIPLPAGDVAALYLVVADEEGRGDRLLGIRSELGDALLHETREVGGVARMREAREGLAVPAHGELRLEPGGPHGMLRGLGSLLHVGDRIHVTLEFERAGRVALEVPVVAAEDAVDVAAGPAAAHPAAAPDAGSEAGAGDGR